MKQNRNKYKNTNLILVAYNLSKSFLLADSIENARVFCWIAAGPKSNLLPMENGGENPKIVYTKLDI